MSRFPNSNRDDDAHEVAPHDDSRHDAAALDAAAIADELDGLLSSLVDGGLDAAREQRLESIVRDDRAARARYLDYVRLHALLEIRHAQPRSIPEQIAHPAADDAAASMSYLPSGRLTARLARAIVRPTPFSIGAAIFVVAAILTGMSLVYFRDQPPVVQPAPAPPSTDSQPVARVAALEDCTWSEREFVRGESLESGALVELASGMLQIDFVSGARVLLQRGARFRIDGNNAATLLSGTASADVPEHASGFTIQTRLARLVDLGTRFGAHVDPEGAMIVSVDLGSVEVTTKDKSGVPDETRRRMLRGGESLRIEPSGHSTDQTPERIDFLRSDVLTISPGFRRWDRYSRRVRRDPDLVAYYTFDRHDDASRLVNHASGTFGAFDGRLVNVAGEDGLPGWSRGRWPSKGALRMDARRGHRVFVSDWPRAGMTRELTVAAWVRLAGVRPAETIVCDWGPDRNRVFHLSTRARGLAVRLAPDGKSVADYIQSTTGTRSSWDKGSSWHKGASGDRRWTHVALTISAGGGAVRLYENGRPLNVGTPVYPPERFPEESGPLSIGGRPDGGSGFSGWIDELAVFRRTLKPEEIIEAYEMGKPD